MMQTFNTSTVILLMPLKGSIICDAHGILRHMQLGDFTNYSDNPQASKHIHDSTLFKPTLTSFFDHHPHFKAKYIAGDSGFDSAYNHNSAFYDFGLIPVISLNRRNTNYDIPKPTFTSNGPCCPRDISLPLKYCGITKEKNRATRFKYICPKAKLTSDGFIVDCNNPCSDAACGYIHYEYEPGNLRENPHYPKRTLPNISPLPTNVTLLSRSFLALSFLLTWEALTSEIQKLQSLISLWLASAHLVTVLLAYRMDLPHKVRSSKSIA